MSETKLPSQQANYADLFERLLDTAVLLDAEEFKIIDLNSSCERHLEATREELLGQPIITWVEQQSHAELLKSCRMAKRRYYPRELTCTWISKTGKSIPMQLAICSLTLLENKDVIQVVAQDITQQREAEKKAAAYLTDLQEVNKKLEELSITDEMTKLANFRQFKNQLTMEHERSRRYKSSYSIVFCDVDHFKKYNDQNGHPAGDALLRTLGQIFLNNRRKTDLPARYGGEEFAILCPETDLKGALIYADRLRILVENYPFPFAEKQPLGKVSISVGVSNFPDDGQTHEEVLKAADLAVYASKHGGRNRVTTSEDRKKNPPEG